MKDDEESWGKTVVQAYKNACEEKKAKELEEKRKLLNILRMCVNLL